MHGYHDGWMEVHANRFSRRCRMFACATAARCDENDRRMEELLDESHVAKNPRVAGVVECASIREAQHVPKRMAWRDRVHCRHGVDVHVSDVLNSADVDGHVMSIGDLHRFDVIAWRDDFRVAYSSEERDPSGWGAYNFIHVTRFSPFEST